MSQNSQNSSSSSSSSKLVLYSFWASSCSWRVRFALNLKGLTYEYKAVNLAKGEQFSPEFEHLNPLRLVPVLVDGDFVVFDSFAIILIAGIVSSGIQPLQMLRVLKDIEEKVGPEERLLWAQHHIKKGFSALEELLKGFSGTYSTGDEISMADVFLAPQINNAYSRFNVDMLKFPTLSRIYDAYMVLPAFQASLPEQQPDAFL